MLEPAELVTFGEARIAVENIRAAVFEIKQDIKDPQAESSPTTVPSSSEDDSQRCRLWRRVLVS